MKKLLLLTLSSLLFVSCSTSDNPVEKQDPIYNYSDGILFVNEGAFQSNTASIGFSNFQYTSITADIYNNKDRKLGDIAQSIGFDTDKAYIVVNNSNKIEVVNRYSFENIATIEQGLNGPRYTTVTNGKLYVTNAGSSSVSIYDIKDYKLIKELPMNHVVENIISENNKVYVQKSNYGIGNQIAIIDGKTDQIIKEITLEDNIQGLANLTGFVYAISSIDTRSNFYKINANNDSIITTFTTTKVPDAKNLRIDNNVLYYTSKNNIHSWSTIATEVNDTPVVRIKDSGSFEFLYGFAAINNQFLVSNAEDFIKPSTVDVYNLEGKKINTFKTATNTNNFYKN